MTTYTPQDPHFADRVRASFAKQKVMNVLGASLTEILPGQVAIELPYRDDLTQQHGFLHAGVVTTIVDTACGYAALSLMPTEAAVLTIEYKVNFMSPALGERVIAIGRVTKPGRNITVCTGDVLALNNGKKKLVATMLATMMSVRDSNLQD